MWNYRSTGTYFVTACCKNRESFFGKVINGVMYPNDLGLKVEEEWLNTVKVRKYMNIELDEYIVMPNHFHGILDIGKNKFNHMLENKFGSQSNNLGSIMRGFKGSVKRFADNNSIRFNWQPRYHDRIIRDKNEFFAIRNYIKNNPRNWETSMTIDLYKCDCEIK
jgi:putative transposase